MSQITESMKHIENDSKIMRNEPQFEEDNEIEMGEQRGLNGYTLLVLLVAMLGGLVFGLDIGTAAVESMNHFRNATGIPPLIPGESDSKATTNKLTMFAVLFHVMTLLGAPFAGQISDKYGRKVVILIAGALFLAGALWQSLAGLVDSGFAWTSILLGRVVGGVGNGFILTIMPVYASELSPAKYRGQVVTTFQLSITLGIFLMAVANNWLDDPTWGWRIAFVLQAIPCAVIIILTLIALPESPRYLLLRGRDEEARAALHKLSGGHPNGEAIVEAEIAASKEEVERILALDEGTFFDLFRGEGVAPLLCGFMIAFSQNVTGVNWFMNYATTIFSGLGYNKFLCDLILKGLNLVSTIAAIFIIERGGRKFLTSWGSLMTIFIFTCITLVIAVTGVDVIGGPSDHLTDSVRMFTMIMIFLFQIGFAITWGPLGWVVPGEVFPLRLRGKGMSMCVVGNMITNIALGDYGFQALKVATSLQFTTFMLVVLNVVIVLTTVVFFQPETKGVSLEDMPVIFNYRVHGGEGSGTMKDFFRHNMTQFIRIITFRQNDPVREVLIARRKEDVELAL